MALDGISKKNALSIARKLKKTVWGFKINDLLFEDPKIVKELKRYGKVFADAKLYDIPNTVKNSVQRLSKLGADIITVHASGGVAMMRVAKEAAGKSKIVGVTVLTSQPGNQKKSVLKLAKEAQSAGLDGVVCSAQELPYLSRIKLLKIVPGIRPVWYKTGDDQRRTATPKEAIKAGADLIIIGRPITESKDLKEAINDL